MFYYFSFYFLGTLSCTRKSFALLARVVQSQIFTSYAFDKCDKIDHNCIK